MSCQGQKILIVWHGPVCFHTLIIPKGSRTRFGRVWRSGFGLVWSWGLRTRCMSFLRLLLPQVSHRQLHELLLGGGLQRRHPVGLPGHRPLKYVAHVPGVAEVLVPLLVERCKILFGIFLGLMSRSYTRFYRTWTEKSP